MPAVSQKQKRLMAWAYSCKTGKAKNCPMKVQDIGDSMSVKQLKDFFEGIIYDTSSADNALLNNFLVWMDSRHIEYIYDEPTGKLEIYDEFSLTKNDDIMLLQYAKKLDLTKVWERGEYVFEDGAGNAEGGTTTANLGNTHGMGSVRPAAGTTSGSGGVELRGSGDRFDSFDRYDDGDDDDEEKKKLKRKKKRKDIEHHNKKKKEETEEHKNKQRGVKMESIYISLEDFINEDVLLLSERLTAKRKYTDKHPSVDINYSAPIRNKVLAFVSGKGEVSEEEMKEFFNSLEEDLGRKANWSWVKSNSNLIKKFENEGKPYYKLTERGSKILKRYNEFNKNNN